MRKFIKYIGIYFLVLLVINIISSLLCLTNISEELITKTSIILNIINIFVISLMVGRFSNEKGFLVGLKLSIIIIIIMIIFNLIFFQTGIKLSRFIYYLILIATSSLGSSVGKNFLKKK